MKDLLRRAAPSKFEDLAAFNALYRPGALSVGMVEEYIQRKTGRKKVRYTLPQTKAILEETYGVIAYQEQVMQIAVEVAGFTMGEADVLRKAMGKKSEEMMAKQKEKFVSGAAGRGVEREKAAELWEYIEPFAGYGFNKSHSLAYAMLAYKTAYLKAHHPLAFMAAMLTSEMGSSDEISKYIGECRDMGIAVLPPDINESNWAFTVVGERIRFGLGAVKGVGEGAVEAILAARRRVGRFDGIAHVAVELDSKQLNQKVFDCLVKAGSFDSLGVPRAALCASIEKIVEHAQQRRKEREAGQGALFAPSAAPGPSIDSRVREWPEVDRLRYEKETLGFYLTGNPLAAHEEQMRHLVNTTTAQLRDGSAEGTVTVGGIVTRLRPTKIKSGINAGKMMTRFVLEDLTGGIPITLFADQTARFGGLLRDEAVIIVRGAVRNRGSEVELSAEEIVPLEQAKGRLVAGLEIAIGQQYSTREMLRLRDLLAENPGDVPVSFDVAVQGSSVSITVPERFRVRLGPELESSIEGLLGQGSVRRRYASA